MNRCVTVLVCLFLAGCSESLSGEWSIDAISLSSGDGAGLSPVDGGMVIERDGTTSFEVVLGDPQGEYLEINTDGTATNSDDTSFSFDLTGFQEIPESAIFVDLTLDCTRTETTAECSGLWESVGLENQTFTSALTAL